MIQEDLLRDMNGWLQDVRHYVMAVDADLLPYFEECENEALFGRRFIAHDMDGLANGVEVLEVGAGSFLLSCQLVREGYQVTALEPTGEGFSHFERLRRLVLKRAAATGCEPRVLNCGIEELADSNRYDYVFSINVMEHVRDVATAIHRIVSVLRPKAFYHFTCPNYLFPYDAHFNIPTLFSKKLTGRIFRRIILQNKRWPDPPATWNSINWISLIEIVRIGQRIPGVRVKFNRQALVSTLERVVTDEAFASRRSGWVKMLIWVLIRCRIYRLAGFLPLLFQPLLDCTLTRRG